MANNNNLKPFKKGVSGNPKGRKKGVRNRSSIIREVFNSISVLNEEDFNQLQSKFPHIKNDMSIEYLMTLVQVNNAIFKGDLRAYKVLNEALYGTPIKELNREVEEDSIKKDEIDFTLLTDEELRILIKAFTKED
jgi:hypothetical protein|tara:strand:- start:383 stop:787 length:405 start_codon:yes stop_codon:yes gene_type:complete